MPNSSLSPVSVVQYHRDYIIELVRYITGWKERSEVSSKDQLHYICSYLEVDHINCQTIVVESEYIERHYLEDYAEYYARCFPAHPRTCSRLHFFSSAITEAQFNKCLRNEDDSVAELLRKSYIGFAVLRPIPHTVFARVCLRPYAALVANPNCKILTRKVHVSLFGLELTVDTIPFLEQDRVVSACATSALWVALSTDPDMSLNDLPSPSAITKAATTGGLEAARTFPTAGLSPPQMLRGLRHYGLEPSILWGSHERIEDLQAQIYSYLSNDTAVILGGDIYRKKNGGAERLGSHLVCVTGFALDEWSAKQDGNIHQHLLSDLISKFYVHDDRSGPYLRLFTKLKQFSVGHKKHNGLEMSVADRGEFYLVPSIAIVGLYHKIRIPYGTVQGACSALYKYLYGTRSDLSNLKRKGSTKDKARDKQLVKFLDLLLEGYWEISLTTSSKVKRDLIESNDFISFNGLSNKVALLVRNMPKYVWRCRILDKDAPDKRRRIADILFDATEVPQGEIVVGIISFTFEVQEAWNYVEACVRKRVWQSWKTDDPDAEAAVRSFIRFFTQDSNNSYLNDLAPEKRIPC